MTKRRVVVTGLGVVSPVGNTVAEAWQQVLAGKSGIRRIEKFVEPNLSVQIAGEVRNFSTEGFIDAKEARKMDAFIHYGLVAGIQAVEDAGFLAVPGLNLQRIGVSIGSGIGGLPAIERSYQNMVDNGVKRISPFFIPSALINMAAGHLSIRYGFQGPNFSTVTACTSSTHSIGQAAKMIAYDDADIMIAGGTEMATSALGIGGFAAARALSTRNDAPEAASRPWDKDRDGFVLSEGAAILVLEEYEHAKKRGAKIYAEFKGFGMSADAHHMTTPSPDGSGAVHSMQNALRDAALNLDDIQYVNAHATSTPVGDIAESNAIKRAFADHAYRLLVGSTKSMTGHLLGAAGAIEALFCVLALRDQVVPPTINLDTPDAGCDLDYVPHTAREVPLTSVLSNSFGFGGTNGTLIFTKF